MTCLIKYVFQKKIEDLNLHMFNIITGIEVLKKLTKYTSCKCKSKFDGTKCSSNQNWNNKKNWCECKKHHICEKIIFGILLHVAAKMVNI